MGRARARRKMTESLCRKPLTGRDVYRKGPSMKRPLRGGMVHGGPDHLLGPFTEKDDEVAGLLGPFTEKDDEEALTGPA